MNETKQADTSKRSRPGGRSAEVVSAIYAAALEVLQESGYDGLELPEVAARAGVNKTTVYRRWPTKAELVLDIALLQMKQDVPLPDTGSLHGDLTALLVDIHTAIASPLVAGLLQAAVSQGRDAEVVKRSRMQFWSERFAMSGQLVERAIERGELPPSTEPRQLLELASAPLFFRAVLTGEAIGRDEIAQIARRTILAFTSD
ncbi:MAG: TetR/AcrR family transcriptional regulator [Pseudomonas sp.]|uniref:TetR/AcrR family transcriptional regulator n=1 Tax=Pseudomonas sp. TaxID=306 RepID=UPI0030F32E9A